MKSLSVYKWLTQTDEFYMRVESYPQKWVAKFTDWLQAYPLPIDGDITDLPRVMLYGEGIAIFGPRGVLLTLMSEYTGWSKSQITLMLASTRRELDVYTVNDHCAGVTMTAYVIRSAVEIETADGFFVCLPLSKVEKFAAKHRDSDLCVHIDGRIVTDDDYMRVPSELLKKLLAGVKFRKTVSKQIA